jgi:hypothetical protein
MARRSIRNRFSGRTFTTGTLALGALIGSFVAGGAETARGEWGGEPQSSVLVEGGILAGSDPYRMAASPDMSQSHATTSFHDPIGCCDDPNCPGCTGSECRGCQGTGCNQCGRKALFDTCCDSGREGCWVGRADALLLWRNAPPDRFIATNPLSPNDIALDANGMDSEPAAGPRFTLMRVNNCTGHAIEATYLRAYNFRSLRPLSEVSDRYQVAAPGIYGNPQFDFDSANADLGSSIQSFEFNRHHALGRNVRFIGGFRWIEWNEQFSISTIDNLAAITDFYQTGCINDLYGGQIGLDANLLNTSYVRFDGVVKAGAYYNNAVQSSIYTTNDPLNPGSASVAVGDSPASGAFAGEVGLTAVVSVTRNIDVRLGYFGLWLSGIAQPTQQLSGQSLTPGQPAVGSLNTDGSVIVQGVSLGLEGRY